jgi:hypothetical protein
LREGGGPNFSEINTVMIHACLFLYQPDGAHQPQVQAGVAVRDAAVASQVSDRKEGGRKEGPVGGDAWPVVDA